MKLSRRKKIILATLGGLVVWQVASYLLFASYSLPAIALRLTPDRTHVRGESFSWVWLQIDDSTNLSERQKVRMRSLLRGRYGTVYTRDSEIPADRIRRNPKTGGFGYVDGFRFLFYVVSQGPFWVEVDHLDSEGVLGGSCGRHVYVWVLGAWIRVHDRGPMIVS